MNGHWCQLVCAVYCVQRVKLFLNVPMCWSKNKYIAKIPYCAAVRKYCAVDRGKHQRSKAVMENVIKISSFEYDNVGIL